MSMDGWIEIALAPNAAPPLEAHAIVAGTQELATSNRELINVAMIDAPKWLQFAAEIYNISPKIQDYILVPCTIMYSDLPNRNLVSFPFSELTRFNPEAGQLAYQTWKGKPTHLEHANQDHTKAKGVIFDTAIRPVPGYHGDLYKVVALLGFDRNRDPDLAASILSGKANAYSMGALVMDYRCSCCAASMRKSNGRCEHIDLTKRADLSIREYAGKQAYRVAHDIVGIEVSSVGVPAYSMAIGNPI